MENNFDGLRLIAALQVVYFHASTHLHIAGAPRPVQNVLGLLPGVPVFFIISGFLISASFERNPNLLAYARNRALRIFPALWICFAATLALLGIEGFLTGVIGRPIFTAWTFGQLSFGQFINLSQFRHFGVGVPNGSVWTISVELSFYLAIPVLYAGLIDRRSKRASNLGLIVLASASFVVAIIAVWVDPSTTRLSTKLLDQTAIPHLYLFLLGVIAQRNYGWISGWIQGKAFWWTVVYIPIGLLAVRAPSTISQCLLFLLARILLAGWLLSMAFSARSTSNRILRGNDVSYGVYLFHMLIVNALVQAGALGHTWLLPAVLLGSISIGWISWKMVEQPSLRLKVRPALHAQSVRS